MRETDRTTLAMRANGTPFAILYEPRAIPNTSTAPKKRGPKPNKSKAQKSAMALETPAERRARQLQVNSSPNFNVPIATQADSLRTAVIKGRAL